MGNAHCHACSRPVAIEADAAGDERVAQHSDAGTISENTDSTIACPQIVETPPDTGPPEWALPVGGRLTVMMFGMTGAGKSALGNLLANATVFQAADDTASVTNLNSCMRHEAPDASLVILDTIGLGDTELDQDTVVASIRDVAVSAPFGVDILLFVMRHARITDDAIARLIFVTEFLWGQECLLNLYIVVTHASRYVNNKTEAIAWIERQAEINWRFKHIYGLVGNNPHRFIFIDNPDPDSGEPMVEERKRVSREALMKSLCVHPREAVPPFTHEMMREAAKLSAHEMKELKLRLKEEQDLQQETSEKTSTHTETTEVVEEDSADVAAGAAKVVKKPAAGRPRPKKAPARTSSHELATRSGGQELRERRARARQKREEAEKALRQRLEDVKASAEFQAQAQRSAGQASQSFIEKYKDAPEVALGAPQAGGATSAVTACKRMIGNLVKSMGRAKSLVTPRTSEEAPGSLPQDKPPEVRRPPPTPEEIDRQLDTVLVRLSGMLRGGAREIFETKAGSAVATLSPVAFTKFLAELDPGLKKDLVGGLWRRGDRNCDGQLDLDEFCTLFDSLRSRSAKAGAVKSTRR
mmetsp:Transcript_96588/g.278821  ORF Transcript_96588/g.278821 Transcript_96588/m.278821 type:complete len:584 (+) Transcript_96588:67-1818(+)